MYVLGFLCAARDKYLLHYFVAVVVHQLVRLKDMQLPPVDAEAAASLVLGICPSGFCKVVGLNNGLRPGGRADQDGVGG